MRKKVYCTHCHGEMSVAHSALSSVCPHCNKRLVLENFKIKTYHAVREFATTGDVVVEPRGRLVANVRAANLIVDGEVRGAIVARERVSIHKHGTVKGDIDAPLLAIEAGAMLDGFLRIGGAAPVAIVRKKPAARKRVAAKK